MARSTFYYHTKHLGQPDGYAAIRERIRAIYHKHRGRYGYRRVTDQLHADGIDDVGQGLQEKRYTRKSDLPL